MGRKSRKIMKQVEVEVEIDENDQIQKGIDYCNEVKDVYKNFEFNVLKDSQGYDKIEVQSRKTRVPFVIRFSRYRMVVKSFFNNTKKDAVEQSQILGFNWESRDLGNATTKATIWYSKVFSQTEPEFNTSMEPDFKSFKIWLDYMCSPHNKPMPKLSMNNNHF